MFATIGITRRQPFHHDRARHRQHGGGLSARSFGLTSTDKDLRLDPGQDSSDTVVLAPVPEHESTKKRVGHRSYFYLRHPSDTDFRQTYDIKCERLHQLRFEEQ